MYARQKSVSPHSVLDDEIDLSDFSHTSFPQTSSAPISYRDSAIQKLNTLVSNINQTPEKKNEEKPAGKVYKTPKKFTFIFSDNPQFINRIPNLMPILENTPQNQVEAQARKFLKSENESLPEELLITINTILQRLSTVKTKSLLAAGVGSWLDESAKLAILVKEAKKMLSIKKSLFSFFTCSGSSKVKPEIKLSETHILTLLATLDLNQLDKTGEAALQISAPFDTLLEQINANAARRVAFLSLKSK